MSETTRAVLFVDAVGEWRFHLVSKGNNRIVAQSEGYANEGDAFREAAQIVGRDDVTYS